MKKSSFFLAPIVFLAMALSLMGCGESMKSAGADAIDSSGNKKIKVGIFDGHGGAQTCVWEAYEALRRDADMQPVYITSAEIAAGVLDGLDAIIIPGGGGSRQWLNLGAENRKRIAEFAENGGGVLGICAGAYLLSSTPEYSCMGLSKGAAIDIEHDNRGHGVVNVTLDALGKKLFPELSELDTVRIMYYEGPVYDTVQRPYEIFATMQSDVHMEGNAPANMTNQRPFLIGNTVGEGRVMACIAHPEATPGMQWMVPRMIRWTLQREFVPYSEKVVNPGVFTKEILMSESMLKREHGAFKVFLYGTGDEKLEALEWLRSVLSWEAKRWVQGLLYDGDARVRAAAAQYIAWMGYTRYLPDVKAAAVSEQDAQAKELIEKACQQLEQQVVVPLE